MLKGTLTPTREGFCVEVYFGTSDGRTYVERYRVTVMNGQPESDAVPVDYRHGYWSGPRITVGTEPYPYETFPLSPVKPRGARKRAPRRRANAR